MQRQADPEGVHYSGKDSFIEAMWALMNTVCIKGETRSRLGIKPSKSAH